MTLRGHFVLTGSDFCNICVCFICHPSKCLWSTCSYRRDKGQVFVFKIELQHYGHFLPNSFFFTNAVIVYCWMMYLNSLNDVFEFSVQYVVAKNNKHQNHIKLSSTMHKFFNILFPPVQIYSHENANQHSGTLVFLLGHFLSSIPFLFLLSISSSLVLNFMFCQKNEVIIVY